MSYGKTPAGLGSVLVAFAALTALCVSARCQQSCVSDWLPAFGPTPGVSGSFPVRALASFDDGRGGGPALYIGGGFGMAGGLPASGIARWDGAKFTAPGNGQPDEPFTGAVYALLVHDDGRGAALYAAGDFDEAGGVNARRIARWDGAAWSAIGPGLGYPNLSNNEAAFALAEFDDGSGAGAELYAAGNFSAAGGIVVNHVAKWDGTRWIPLGTGTDGMIFALAVYDDGGGPALYAGGAFASAGGRSALHIARWDGTTWTTVGSGIPGEAAQVDALEVADLGDGNGPCLFVGGSFTVAGGTEARNVARWDGSTWSALGAGAKSEVRTLLASSQSGVDVLWVGGSFKAAGDLHAGYIASWDGHAWSPTGNGMDEAVYCLALYDIGEGPQLHAGGAFLTSEGLPTNKLARWNGSQWLSLGKGFDGAVRAFTHANLGSGEALYASGAFFTAPGVKATHVARWNGTVWSPLGSGLSQTANALVAHASLGGGPAVFAAGDFSTAGGVPAKHLARWDGASWSPVGGGTNASIAAMTILDRPDAPGPLLYVSGSFSEAGGSQALFLACWDGAAWSAPGMMSDFVVSLASFDDGKGSGPALFAGGAFTTTGSVAAQRIARWDGAAWSPLGSGMAGIAQPAVRVLLVHDDGAGDGPALYAAGDFETAGGMPANNIARWNGTSWSSLGGGLDGSVTRLASFDDGSGPALFASGAFTTAGGLPANHLAKWNGSAWIGLGDGLSDVQGLGVFDDGTGKGPLLYVGGDFVNPATTDRGLTTWGGCAPPLPAWTSLGFALPGVAGAPLLAGSGTLEPGTPGALTLGKAAALAPTLLFVSPGGAGAAFKGGYLVPVPVAFALPLLTSAAGALSLTWQAWPGNLGGTSLYFQCAIQDAAGAHGAALSNALRADVP